MRTERQLFIEEIAARQPIPAQWGQGPIPDRFRTVTDAPCLFLYGLFCAFLLFSGIWAFSNSSNSAFTKVIDSSGNVCGQGAARAFPLLYLQTFSAPYRSVCVSECPRFDYNELMGGSGHSMNFEKFSRKFAGPSYTRSEVMTEAEAFAFPRSWANGAFSQTQWMEYTSRFRVKCLPNNQFSGCDEASGLVVYDSYRATRAVCTPVSPKAALLFNKISSRFHLGSLEDLTTALPLFGWTALIAIGISLLFLAITFFLSRSIVWVLLGLLTAALIGAAAMILQGLYGHGHLNNPINPLRVKYLQFWMDYRPALFLVVGGLALLACYAIYQLFWYRRYMGIASHLVHYASKSTLRQSMLLGLSVFILLLQIAVFFLEIMTISRLLSSGPELSDLATPFVRHDNPWWAHLLALAHGFGLYWHLCVLNNLNHFVVSATVVDFYFRSRIAILHAFCHSVGHHLGSICWTLVLLPIAVIKSLFGIFDLCITSDRPNAIQQALRKALSLCCWGWENFIEVYSDRFMPITYIGCYNFVPANQTVYALTQIHGDLVGVMLNVGNIISLGSRAIVALFSTFCGYRLYLCCIVYQQNIDNLWLIWICLLVLSWFIADLFLSIFSKTYDATYICHLIEINLTSRGYPTNHAPAELINAINEYKSYVPLN